MNIDWPSHSNIPSEQQKQELIDYLDTIQSNNMNAVIFQIRPSADAFYYSEIENWSRWLAGENGKIPNPFYDPLEFLIKEARKRCIEVHVWLNPYRALTNITNDKIPEKHICNRHPEWFIDYGNKRYFDPGIPAVQNYICEIVKDIVNRYDIDAVHFDDYFYPYKIAGVEFPDHTTFKKFNSNFKDINAWRRENVNSVIKQIAQTIKNEKPHVRFGISPFGVWRNKKDDPRGSDSKALQTNYDHLHADVLNWINNKYIDYLVPQLYWRIGNNILCFDKMTQWWQQYSKTVDLYIGHGLYNMKKTAKHSSWRTTKEIEDQLNICREAPLVKGSVFYSAKFLKQNNLNINNCLRKKYYTKPALIHEYNHYSSPIPSKPKNIKLKNNILRWNRVKDAWYYGIYKVPKNSSSNEEPELLMKTSTNFVKLDISKIRHMLINYGFQIRAINRQHKESEPSKVLKFKIER
jgi:uncharacterized lipoprotein YddW (UPF0748 family)